jgi:hypothetical protein
MTSAVPRTASSLLVLVALATSTTADASPAPTPAPPPGGPPAATVGPASGALRVGGRDASGPGLVPASTTGPATPRADGGATRRLRFGVYPWAPVGATDPVAGPRPEDPPRTLANVRDLAGSRPFVVRLYGEYSGEDVHAAGRLLDDARWWSHHGLRVEMALRYRPAGPELARAYGPWVRWVARRLARIKGVVAIQVGNEANNHDAAAAADGAYPGAARAIARAVPVARRAVVAAGRRDIGIGINWAAGKRPCARGSFWRTLRSAGGSSFASSLSWVGVDVYPGTWSAPARGSAPGASAVDRTVTQTLRCARTRHIPDAGLPRRVRITVAETGYPTGAQRSESTQQAVLVATVGAVQRVAARYGVTDLRWFSLRDSNTASGQLENGYGLLRDDHSPKPAYASYRDLVAGLGR